ncbi:MAG: hypothetical protein Q9228_004839 [Teloschistes exilis]
MSLSTRKKQTRLSLTPLPSSSPGALGLNEKMQNRAAAVRFSPEGSPTKKRRVVLPPSSGQTRLDDGQTESLKNSADADPTLLPTPIPSSQPIGKQEGIRPNQLPNSASSSDAEDAIVDSRTRSSRRVRPSKDKESFSNGTRNGTEKSKTPTVLDRDAGDTLRSTSIKRGQQGLVKASKRSIVVSSGKDSEPMSFQSAQPSAQKQEDYPRTPQSSRRKPSPLSRRGLRFIVGGLGGIAPIGSSRKQVIATPTRSSKRMPASKQRHYSPTDESPSLSRRSRQESPAKSDDSTDSYMNELKESARKSPKPPRDEEVTGGSAIKVSRLGKKPLRRIRSPSGGEPEASEPGSDSGRHQNTPQRRGARTRPKRPDTKKLARGKQLELLRQRRSGKAAVPVPDDLDIGSPNEDSQVAETDSEASADSNNSDDFVVDDDDDDTVGAPVAHVGIPIQFTRHAHKKQIEHFRDVVEWMIHNKVNPAFERNNEVYGIAIQKLDDAAQGIVGSKFMSAAWNAEFSRALKKYPKLESIAIPRSPTSLDQKCEACNRSGHPAKHRLIFDGEPYDRKNLEPFCLDEESDDAEERPFGTANKTVFLLGSHCNANAKSAHALQHWRHALNADILEYLRTNKHLSRAKIIERAEWNVRKRERYANGVVEEMEADGSLRMLYKEFKDNLDAAMNATNEHPRRRR